jgi:hypothetical protein
MSQLTRAEALKQARTQILGVWQMLAWNTENYRKLDESVALIEDVIQGFKNDSI